jgi:hypothetical protein
MRRPEKVFCPSKFDFSTFLSFYHLSDSLSSQPRFLGFFEYFPPARASYSSGNREVLKTCSRRNLSIPEENAIFWHENFPLPVFYALKSHAVP